MTLGMKLMKVYFDLVYNPVYDFTTAQLASYHRLQSTCVDKFEFGDGDRVLCVGVGTGNEIIRILRVNSKVSIVGVDCSDTALKSAYKKALTWGKKIEVLTMDTQSLEFTTGSFDKVLCLHVMDFIEDERKTTAEILRVLKRGGQFVLTYPSGREGLRLGISLLKENLHHNSSSFKSLLKLLAMFIGAGIVYPPLLLRGNRRSYSSSELEVLFTELKPANFQIEEYAIYQDFIVYGRK